nr:MAG TPA: hypothetical protein [Caudoviricetes sp.]
MRNISFSYLYHISEYQKPLFKNVGCALLCITHFS